MSSYSSAGSLRRRLAIVLAAFLAIALVPLANPAGADVDSSAACANVGSAGFTDTAGNTFEAYIDCLAAFDVTQGTTPTTYNPNGFVQRQQMALFYYRIGNLTGQVTWDTTDAGFTDLGGLSVEARNAVNALANAGIVTGKSASTFDPLANITRSQMALFVDRAQGALAPGHTRYSSYLTSANPVFPDISAVQPDEAITAIKAIKLAGIVDGDTNGNYRPADNVTRGQMAKFLVNHLAENGYTAPSEAATYTAAPELLSVTTYGEDDPDVAVFQFDMNVNGATLKSATVGGDVVYYGLRLYDSAGVPSFPIEASIQGDKVLARFDSNQVSTAIRAGVSYDAVRTVTAIPNLEGFAALNPWAIDPTVPATALELLSVENYRTASVTGGGVKVFVDYIFNYDPNISAADPASDDFALIANNSAQYEAESYTASSAITSGPNAGRFIVTATFSNDVTEVPRAQLKRGYWQENGATLVLSAPVTGENGVSDGLTVDPDLVQVKWVNNTTVEFLFDEVVDPAAAVLNASSFFIYNHAGTTVIPADRVVRTATESGAGKIVIATFDAGMLSDEIAGGFIHEGAAKGTDQDQGFNSGFNRSGQVSVVIQPNASIPVGRAAGDTELPDLVNVVRNRNVVTGNYTVTFVFDDEIATAGDWNDVEFDLYDTYGTQFRVDGSDSTDVNVVNGRTHVVFSVDDSTSHFDNDQIEAAIVGAAEWYDQLDGLPAVTEGAKKVVG